MNNLKNVEIIDKALYNESGKKIEFYQNGVMSKIVNDDTKDSGTIFVETITFDDILTEYKISPNVLKMDIEGGEKFALLSARNMMKTLNYFEAEIHSKEDWNELRKYSNYFSFKRQEFESKQAMHNVFSFGIKHPLKVLKLEYYNRFMAIRRIFLSMKNSTRLEYPIIVYGEREAAMKER